MTTLMAIVWVFAMVALLIVLGFRPKRTRHSWFELQRRGDKGAIRRERLLGDVLAFRRVAAGVLLSILVLVGAGLWQAPGVLISLGVWLVGGAVSRWKPFRRQAMRLYDKLEPWLLDTAQTVPILGKLFRTDTYTPRDQRLESVEHLLHMVDAADHILSTDQQEIIRRGVHWHDTVVGSVMTPAKDIFSVKHTELLGPLVLDDLHRSGHDRFPVIRGSIDSVIGVLDITDFLEVSTDRRSETAQKAMTPDVSKINENGPLPVALRLLQKNRQHILIVTDAEDKTVGLVTLADLTGSLLGKTGVR